MERKIETLSREEIDRLNSQRKWVREHFTPETEYKYESLEEKLNLLDTIIKSNWISKDETVKLQSLGVTFGDCLAQKMDLKWMSVSDEYGKDPSLILEGTSIVVFPLTMISKRIEDGAEVDVYGLFDSVCNKINEIKENC
jgi:hypothetical protein